MKINIKILALMPLLAVVAWLLPATGVPAQTFTSLYSFSSPSSGMLNGYTISSNRDGCLPQDELYLSGNVLYGTTTSGGFLAGGTVFQISTDGAHFTNIFNFHYTADPTIRSGPWPASYARTGVVLSGNTLYGTTSSGGINDNDGTVFKVNTDGTGFQVLHNFNGGDGADPGQAGLILAGDFLYGTTINGGGAAYRGAVFRIKTDGTDFTNLHVFTATAGPAPATNSDGASSYAGLVLADDTLYGTTTIGGGSGRGTVFKLHTDGSDFTVIHSFADDGSEGIASLATLALSGDTLYGTAYRGGSSDNGTVFKVNTDGTGFMVLHTFSGSDGATPEGRLAVSGNTLYGTAYLGSSQSSHGTVFQVNADGTGFTNLHLFTSFTGPSNTNSDGGNPTRGVILSGNTLYGMTLHGGSFGLGTIFSLSLGPSNRLPLDIAVSGDNLVLTWPANATGLVLQTNGDLTTGGWNDYGGTVATDGNTDRVTILPPKQNLFFRLKSE